MNISLDKKYKSNERPIRILCVDRPNNAHPVVGIYNDGTVAFLRKMGQYHHLLYF
jgi:hypothetical protein